MIRIIPDIDFDATDWTLLGLATFFALLLAGYFIFKPDSGRHHALVQERAQLLRNQVGDLQADRDAQFVAIVEQVTSCILDGRGRFEQSATDLAQEAECARQALLETARHDPEGALELWGMVRAAGVEIPERFGDTIAIGPER